MKKEIYLIVWLLIAFAFINHAQELPCVNEVNTDPNNPTNSSLPLENNNPDFRFLNGFDWVNGDIGN